MERQYKILVVDDTPHNLKVLDAVELIETFAEDGVS
jgi:CheY-like chemotaxis protein